MQTITLFRIVFLNSTFLKDFTHSFLFTTIEMLLTIKHTIPHIIDNFDKGCNNNFIGKATISKVAKYTINPIFILKSNEKSSFLILHVIIEPNRKKRINNTNILVYLTFFSDIYFTYNL